VTTTRVTHATPSGTYAHVANRDWEDDYAQSLDDGVDSTTCDDIAEQLVRNSPGKNFKVKNLQSFTKSSLVTTHHVKKVIMGGGRAYFTPKEQQDPETGAAGRRRDGVNLVEEWKTKHPKGKYVTSKDELDKVDIATIDELLG
jgi:alkaline phosphatase